MHGATYTGSAYDDIAEMMGATDAPHRIERAVLKVDDPASPLMKPFKTRTFPFTDEFYRFPHLCQSTCYSREKLHVLLSMDASQTDLVHGDPIYERPDADYGLIWIKSYGKGRVYNNALGHLDTIFTTPEMAAHLLAAGRDRLAGNVVLRISAVTHVTIDSGPDTSRATTSVTTPLGATTKSMRIAVSALVALSS